LYKERQAGRLPIANSDHLDRFLGETYKRISSSSIEESWWRSLLARIEHEYVAPDFLKFPHIQTWLSKVAVERDLILLTRADVLGNETPKDVHDRLAREYSAVTLEDPRLASGPISVVTAILAAGLFSRLASSDLATVAILSAETNDIKAQIQGLAEVVTAKSVGPVISQAVKNVLVPILKRRSTATDRSREEIRSLAARVTTGDLISSDRGTCGLVLYWAARLHSTKPELLAQAKTYLEKARQEDPSIDIRIPRALVMEQEGDAASAIKLLRDGNTPDDRTILFGLLYRSLGEKEALAWFDAQDGKEDRGFVTPLGWYVIVVSLFHSRRYDEALKYLENAQTLVADWPELALLSGVINSAMLLPIELREHALQNDLFHPAIRTMEGQEADTFRSRAYTWFSKAVELLAQVDLPERARIAQDALLWLRLTDTDSQIRSEARNEVQKGMTDPSRAVELIRLARFSEISFDPLPLKNHLTQRSRWGGLTGKEIVAEFFLSEVEMSPLERAEFIAKEEKRLSKEIQVAALVAFQVDGLIQGNQCTRARDLLESRKTDLAPGDYERLLANLTSREGGDPRKTLEGTYTKSKGLIDLHNLCGYLWHVGDWTSLRPFLSELFRRERTLENAQKLAMCMRRDSKSTDAEILEVLNVNDDLVAKSDDLKSAKAWALFATGRGSDAKHLNDQLVVKRKNRADLMLDMNLALQMGDWERFTAIIDREWKGRDDLDAEALMQLAALASEADNSADRALELARIAARKEPSNAKILLGAYALGFQLGREDKVDPEWLKRALELSTGAGPVWKVDLKTLAEEMVPAHRQRARKLEEDLLHGTIPIQAAAKGLNVPLAKVFVEIPKHNSELHDGRGRTVLPVVSGGRPAIDIQPTWRIALDTTSVMILWSLGLLGKAIESFAQIVLPPDIMVELLNERRRVLFHQPSLVAQAEEIRELIDLGLLKCTRELNETPVWLVEEVGRDLAELLLLAKEEDGRAVRPLPIPKLSSFMQKEADLKEYHDRVLSCTQFVRALHDSGQIDAVSYRRAQEYLSAHDKSPPGDIDPSVLKQPLFLDDLALTYLRSAGILRHISKAGLDLHVHHTTREEKGAISRAHREGEDSASTLSEIRVRLRDALENGKAVLFATAQPDEANAEGLGPLAELFPALHLMLNDTTSCDAICIDDRFFNRHTSLSDRKGRAVSIICLPDVIRFLVSKGSLNEEQARDAIHRARRAGFVLLPIERADLDRYLRQATTKGGEILETDELRVLRQSVMRVRALSALNQPVETRFLDSLRLACVVEIRELWSDETLSSEDAAALSTWIWNNLSPSPFQWAKMIREPSQVMAPEDAFTLHIAMLLQPMLLLKGERYKTFIEWCDEIIVGPLALANGSILDKVADRLANDIERIVNELART